MRSILFALLLLSPVAFAETENEIKTETEIQAESESAEVKNPYCHKEALAFSDVYRKAFSGVPMQVALNDEIERLTVEFGNSENFLEARKRATKTIQLQYLELVPNTEEERTDLINYAYRKVYRSCAEINP